MYRLKFVSTPTTSHCLYFLAFCRDGPTVVEEVGYGPDSKLENISRSVVAGGMSAQETAEAEEVLEVRGITDSKLENISHEAVAGCSLSPEAADVLKVLEVRTIADTSDSTLENISHEAVAGCTLSHEAADVRLVKADPIGIQSTKAAPRKTAHIV